MKNKENKIIIKIKNWKKSNDKNKNNHSLERPLFLAFIFSFSSFGSDFSSGIPAVRYSFISEGQAWSSSLFKILMSTMKSYYLGAFL